MYWIRLFEGYEDNIWYENGGKEIVDKLLSGEEDYGIRFFFSDPNFKTNDVEIGEDYVFVNKNISPRFSFHGQMVFNKIKYRYEEYLFPKKRMVLWSVCTEVEAEPLFKEIFSIKGSCLCPFLLGFVDSPSTITIVKNNGCLMDHEIKLLRDMSFDQIDDKYFLISQRELSRTEYDGVKLTFNLDTNFKDYEIPFSNLKWHDLKYRNCEQYVL